MKVRAWLISQGAEGVGSRGVISRAAWAAVARAAAEGLEFDDYDPAVPGKVSKPTKAPRKAKQQTPVVKPTYRVKSLPVVRDKLTAFTYFKGSDRVLLEFGTCDKCHERVSRCPCQGGPIPPRYTTGEVLWDRPRV